jgi:CheY-like chemotaxis protein
MLTARGETVLLVEDDTAVRMTFAITLEDLGYRVLQAADAETALATLAATEVNVLLTDLRMPGRLDGLELVEVARAGNP